jgi:hypothetical protein
MQIRTLSTQEDAAQQNMGPACPVHCPRCSEALVLIQNWYRCSRCCYQLCASCDPGEPEAFNYPGF